MDITVQIVEAIGDCDHYMPNRDSKDKESVILCRFCYCSATTMIEGICPKCGQRYYGWTLLQPRNQSCPKCGVGLLITEDGERTIQGYSPFTAEEYKNIY